MSTFKSFIFCCALSLKLSTSELDIAEMMDKTATLKTEQGFFPITLRLEGEIFLGVQSF